MTIDRPEVAAQAVHALNRLHEQLMSHMEQYGDEPVDGSPAYGELADPNFSEYRKYLEVAYSQGHVLILSAEDHVTAFLRVTDTLKQAFAPWTCVRAVLEASAMASWLLECHVGVEERVARSFATRYESMDQERKYVEGRGYDVSKTVNKIADLESKALRLGYKKVTDKNGRRIGVARTFPKMMDHIRYSFEKEKVSGEDAYRILSGMAHGRSWVLLQLGFRNIDDSSEGETGSTITHARQIKPVGLVYLCQLAAAAFGKAVLSHCQLFGWEPGKVEGGIDSFRTQFREGIKT